MFKAINDWWMLKGAKAYGKGCARAMLVSALSMKHKYEGIATTHAWLAGRALLTRNNWIEAASDVFMFQPTGDTIYIGHNLSVSDVIQMVIDVEAKHIFAELPLDRRDFMTQVSKVEAMHYLTQA